MSVFPLVHEIAWQEPAQLFSIFAHEKNAVFLDSAALMPEFSRYSFIAIEPFLTLSSKGKDVFIGKEKFQGNPFQFLKDKFALFSAPRLDDLPPFQGGVCGYLSYDLLHHLENIPFNKIENNIPDMNLGFYDLVIACDHLLKKTFIFSCGFPETVFAKRQAHAQKRINKIIQRLNTAPIKIKLSPISSNITSNFVANEYQKAVRQVIDYILNGDIFQANISQRFSAEMPKAISTYDLYQHLRTSNPAPFSAYINAGDVIIASASPERFLKLNANKVSTCPIKGTRKRGKTAEEDMNFKKELLASAKDHAENTMIVDLLRNDLSKVCMDKTVDVIKLCNLVSFASVHHLVSEIHGQLKSEYNAIDLLTATFPGGSITGAPKVRAMEIIAEIEPHARGPYCGSIGYIGFNGDMDSSIVIRTFVIHNDEISFHAGGGIVADSDPNHEYLETLIKAQALMHILK